MVYMMHLLSKDSDLFGTRNFSQIDSQTMFVPQKTTDLVAKIMPKINEWIVGNSYLGDDEEAESEDGEDDSAE